MTNDNKLIIPSTPSMTGNYRVGGGTGKVTAWTRPDLVIAAPGGIGAFTPASSVFGAGNTITLVAGQDLNHAVQGHSAVAIKSGLVFYTYGKATNINKPNTETGISFHAASGNVNTQSQSGATQLTADKGIEVASTTGMVRIAAPSHILLTAAGAAIDIQPGSITLKGPGMIEFRAGMKVLTGGASASTPGVVFASAALLMPKQPLEVTMLEADGGSPSGEPLTLRAADGTEHALSIGSSPATIAEFKPGLSRARQSKRKT